MDSGDLDPNAFLQSVRELKEKRQKEDNERYEQLEAQILQDRELRQARKLERERSLSPEKTTPQSLRFSTREGTPGNASPASRSASPAPQSPAPGPNRSSDSNSSGTRFSTSIKTDPASREGRESPAPMDRSTSPSKPSPGGGLQRSGTLSWQTRPKSISVRSRPLSAVATENSAARSPKRAPDVQDTAETAGAKDDAPQQKQDDDDNDGEAMSKERIAQSLSSKDPAWFRQTADRGRSSAAYRSSKEGSAPLDAHLAKKELPGMARHTSSDAPSQTSPPAEDRPSTSPSRISSVRSSVNWSSRPTSMASISEQRKSDAISPLPAQESQRFAPPLTRERSSTADGEPPVIGRTMSTAQIRLAGDRPASPTKGMGGFVQSAFMKRTDSVNKRWSAQPGGSLSRQDSTASIPNRLGSVRDSATNVAASRSMPRLDQALGSAGAESNSRPGSSHSTISNLALGPDTESKDVFAKPALPGHSHSRSRSVASLNTTPDGLTSPPLSPSKRWSRSPTKASWLESALTRPESPKPSTPTNQPSWMAEISKAKQQRSNGEASLSQDNLDAGKAQSRPRTATLQEIEPLGPSVLKKAFPRESAAASPATRNVTPPTKAKPASLAGRPASLELTAKKADQPKEAKNHEDPVDMDAPEKSAEQAKETDSAAVVKSAALSSPFTSPNPDTQGASQPKSAASSRPSSLVSPRLKPDTPPKKDFRAGLKSRSDLGSAPTKAEPEFKAMFGKLKKAHTDKYVAPDELKSNIMRGKAGLSMSAGPQKSERRDELRDSLIKKKDEMKIKAADNDLPDHKVSPAPAPVLPEALKIKKQLGRSNSSLNVAPLEKQRNVTPEALSLHKTLRGKARAPSPEKPSQSADKIGMKAEARDLVTSKKLGETTDDKANTTARASVTLEKPIQAAEETEIAETKPTGKTILTRDESAPQAVDAAPKTMESNVATTVKPLFSATTTETKSATTPAASKFADRFNPALAGLLARGPPSHATTPRSGSPTAPKRVNAASEEPGQATELTHMTKNRAKGPKRRKPNTKAAKAETEPAKKSSSIHSIDPETTPAKRLSAFQSRKSEDSPGAAQTATPLQPAPKSAAVRAVSLRLSSGQFGEQTGPTGQHTIEPAQNTTSADEKSPIKTRTPAKSVQPLNLFTKPSTQAVSRPSYNTSQVDEKASSRIVSPGSHVSGKPVLPLSLPGKSSSPVRAQPMEPIKASRNITPTLRTPDQAPSSSANRGEDKENNTGSVKNVAAMWGRPVHERESPSKRSSPIQLPTKKDEEAAMRSAGLLSNSPLRYNTPPQGLGISDSPLPGPIKRSTPSTPTSAGLPPRPPVKSSRVVSASLSSKDLPSLPDPRAIEAGRCLADFFGDIPFSSDDLRMDTQSILTARPGESGRIKTLRKTIQEITGDGKVTPLPAQEEHVLYEDSMYICTHVFGSAEGSKVTEAYLWAGAAVSESAIQDAQLFARKIAKEAGIGQKSTQLFVVDQNREPPAFFEALGGIIIVRRGSRTESSTRPYMLCGRPHMGHVAFDEVDLSKASLCSDFPYIVARPVTLQETKIYLWKGKTCGPDAVGMARLIGMDLNPLGEIVEVDEGREPQDLLLLMSDLRSAVCGSPELWSRSKDRWGHSAARLFRIGVTPPKTGAGNYFSSFLTRRPSSTAQDYEVAVKEISPFGQIDLEPEGCFVMDCGHTILVLPGPLLPKQPYHQQAFTQALLFAHDYVILSASMEDRPAMPTANVVMAGLPRDAQLRFRRWDKARGVWGTGGMMAGRRLDALEESQMLDIREALELCCRH